VKTPMRANRRPCCPRSRLPIPFVTAVPKDGSPLSYAAMWELP
jgi:hypothetical protein